MDVFVSTEDVRSQQDSTVGLRAKQLSELSRELPRTFTLTLTSDVLKGFITENNLVEYVRPLLSGASMDDSEIAQAFITLAQRWKSADFSMAQREKLRECFELLYIDTDSLSQETSSERSTVIQLQRSVDYVDVDRQSDKVYYTITDFELFLQKLKTLFLSAFTPSSVALRKQQGIATFSMGVVLTVLPEVYTCYEVTYPFNKYILVESYLGFYDQEGKIAKDRFILSTEFLKIQEFDVKAQHNVVVYNKDTNLTQLQHYVSTSSSQSATEQRILEVGRYAKKIAQVHNGSFNAVFMSSKQGEPKLLALFSTGQVEPTTQPEPQSQQEPSEPLDVQSHEIKEDDGYQEEQETISKQPQQTNEQELQSTQVSQDKGTPLEQVHKMAIKQLELLEPEGRTLQDLKRHTTPVVTANALRRIANLLHSTK